MNDLNETIDLMKSEDYKERFKAEYWQTRIRYEKLHAMLIKLDAGTNDFDPACDIKILKEQAIHMRNYLYVLEVRAEVEEINL